MDSDRPLVLVAHALASYAEPLAIILAEVRPFFRVQLLPAADLDANIAAAPGAVVVANHISPTVETHAGGWLLYYPDHADLAVVGGQGTQRRIESPRFDDILTAIDGLISRLFPNCNQIEAAASSTT